jgi:hypothetical protein
MKRKTLEQKVSWALYGSAIFFAALFTLGLILKADLFSHWPTANEVYEIGRDALTLTAYFLAPLTALLLFSDWRLEHVEKSREQQGRAIYNLVKQVDSVLGDLELEIEDENNFSTDISPIVEDLSKELIRKLSTLQHELNDFYYDDPQANAFRDTVENVLKELRGNYFLLTRQFSVLVKKHNPSKYNYEYLDESDEDFIARQEGLYEEYREQYVENFATIGTHLTELKSLHTALKVKAASPN